MFDLHADLCNVLADPKRLRAMSFLGHGERSVSEIAEHLGVSLPNASQHLRVMRDRGVVRFRKEGKAVLYRLANPKFLEASRLIREALREQQLSKSSRRDAAASRTDKKNLSHEQGE
jgi:DNA-binding transcriptional ArsR family regulator